MNLTTYLLDALSTQPGRVTAEASHGVSLTIDRLHNGTSDLTFECRGSVLKKKLDTHDPVELTKEAMRGVVDVRVMRLKRERGL